MIYLDNCATTPVDPAVLDAMLPYFRGEFGNASSRWHTLGRAANDAVERARSETSALVGCRPEEVIWTSGATESNNLAIKGVARHLASAGRKHIVTECTEHPSVLEACESLRADGFEVTLLPVDCSGRISIAQLAAEIRPDTALVSLMWANNETGVLQPICEVGRLCRERGILFHSDATQAIGKIFVDLASLPVDLLSLSAHKFYGPKGVGALIFRRSKALKRFRGLVDGGGHERGIRSGTLNVPGIVGLGKAAELCRLQLDGEQSRMLNLREQFERLVLSAIPFCTVNGLGAERLNHISNLAFDGIDAESTLIALEEVAASTGSACSSEKLEPSHVLRAMALPESRLRGSIRFSFGRFNTNRDIQEAAFLVASVATKLKELAESSCLT